MDVAKYIYQKNSFEFIAFIGIIVGAYVFVKYNVLVLKFLGSVIQKLASLFDKLFNKRVKYFDKYLSRRAYLNKDSIYYSIYTFFNNIILNMGLQKEKVTVGGFIFFVLLISLFVTLIINSCFQLGGLIIIVFIVAFSAVVILFKLASATKAEKREAMIMDAIDILVSDVRGGIKNAITRYYLRFDPEIRIYFEQFLDDINAKGFSFESAMLRLSENLGSTFTDFAHKAIIYEMKADKNADTIFSSIIDINNKKRNLRFMANKAFQQVRLNFIICFAVIMGYGLFLAGTSQYVIHLFTETVIGKLLLLIDLLLVVIELGFLTVLKSKKFDD